MRRREMERRAEGNYLAYERSHYGDLLDAYTKCSEAKRAAWLHCRDLMAEHDGWGLKVISRNTWMFTAGFEFTNPETGELMFMYITPSYDVAVSAPCI